MKNDSHDLALLPLIEAVLKHVGDEVGGEIGTDIEVMDPRAVLAAARARMAEAPSALGGPSTEPATTDWKKIAEQLAQRVNFALVNLSAPGAGLVFEMDPDAEHVQPRSWREYFAEALEMIPGVTVNRDRMHALGLPAAQRRKRLAELDAMARKAGV